MQVVSAIPYVAMMKLVKGSLGVLTDSGGLQKEAYMLGKRSLTIRSTTEWVETLTDGRNVLDPDLLTLDSFIRTCHQHAEEGDFFDNETYGSGGAAEIIIETLIANA